MSYAYPTELVCHILVGGIVLDPYSHALLILHESSKSKSEVVHEQKLV